MLDNSRSLIDSNSNRGLYKDNRGLTGMNRGLFDISEKKTILKIFKRDDLYDDMIVKDDSKEDEDKETDVSIDDKEINSSSSSISIDLKLDSSMDEKRKMPVKNEPVKNEPVKTNKTKLVVYKDDDVTTGSSKSMEVFTKHKNKFENETQFMNIMNDLVKEGKKVSEKSIMEKLKQMKKKT